MNPDLFKQISTITFNHLGHMGRYIPKSGSPIDIQLIAHPIGDYHQLSEQGIRLDQAQFSVLVSQVLTPDVGDVIEFNQKHYEISQSPECDPYHLVWGVIATCYA